MALKYALIENLLTDSTDDYAAQVQDVKSYDINDILSMMAARGSTVTKSDMLAVFNLFTEEVQRITGNGGTINTDFLKTRISISGVFEGAADGFDPKRHRIKVNASPGRVITRAVNQIRVEKVASTGSQPYILQVRDSIGGSVNENIISGGVVEITGSRLKIVGPDSTNGVYFISDDGTSHKVVTLVNNEPARLIVVVPKLEAGEYTLQVKTQYAQGSILNNPRTGVFDSPLTVS